MTLLPELFSAPLELVVWAAFGYLLGSVPFGLVMARLFRLGNLRAIGSGNIGATNVLRTGNKLAAFLTLTLDSGKGAIAVLVARSLAAEDAVQLAALAAFLGHCFPIYIGFNGGKGVATFLGLLLAISFPIGLAACGTWLATAIVTRISSLSALVAAATSVLWSYGLDYPQLAGLCLGLTILIFYRHSTNISRIIAGTEPRIGKK